MGALSELLRAATPATLATQAPSSGPESQESQESQGGASAIGRQLAILAGIEGLPAAIMDRLSAGDIAACTGLPDNTLRAYLRARHRGMVMDAAIVPDGYTQAVRCAGCGPVLLWPGCAPQVQACPWCFRRRAGKPVPRPE